MYADLETMRALGYQVLREITDLDAGDGGRGPVHLRSAAGSLHAGRSLVRILDNALQIHGGMGYMWETEVNRLYRTGKLLEIGGGTTQVRQLIVAEGAAEVILRPGSLTQPPGCARLTAAKPTARRWRTRATTSDPWCAYRRASSSSHPTVTARTSPARAAWTH